MPDSPGAPPPSRRSILAASLILPLSARAGAARRVPPAALLVPLTGPRAALGRSMARAAALAQGRDAHDLFVVDAGGGAAAAAQGAVKRGAGLILGPLLSAEVPGVLAAVGGKVPVVTFGNDRDLRDGGAFLLGITADQLVAALLRYARGRGIRRIGVAAGADRWDQQVAAAARAIAPREDLEIVTKDADAVVATSPAGAAPGQQLLLAPAATEGADAAGRSGAWIAGPDPDAFQGFASAFESANGSPPGQIAGLAYDGARMVAQMRATGGLDRAAVLATNGFKGVCGGFTFRDDGSATRQLAILTADGGGYRVIDRPTAR